MTRKRKTLVVGVGTGAVLLAVAAVLTFARGTGGGATQERAQAMQDESMSGDMQGMEMGGDGGDMSGMEMGGMSGSMRLTADEIGTFGITFGTAEVRPLGELKLGARGRDLVQVLDGLEPGQRVVTSAQFLLDSESNLAEVMKAMMAQMNISDMGGMDMDTGGGMDMGGAERSPQLDEMDNRRSGHVRGAADAHGQRARHRTGAVTMLRRIIEWSVANKFFVVLATVGVADAGTWAMPALYAIWRGTQLREHRAATLEQRAEPVEDTLTAGAGV